MLISRRTWHKLLIFLLLLTLLPTSGSAKKMMMSYSQLLQQSDLIVIARVVKVQVHGVQQKNTLKIEEVLKGKWPPAKNLVIMTAMGWKEDQLRLGEPGFRAVLFMVQDPSGMPVVIHSIQGVWPLDGNIPAGYGLGESLEKLREDIKKQTN